jgi:uncharacterized coiled-coil protein SlyX
MLGGMTRFEREELTQQLVSRVTDLEMIFTHLQRTVQDLDQVVVRQERRLDTLEQAVQRLTRDVATYSEVPEDPPSLEDERPPHY